LRLAALLGVGCGNLVMHPQWARLSSSQVVGRSAALTGVNEQGAIEQPATSVTLQTGDMGDPW